MGKFKFPSAYTILFFLIAVVAALSWIVPAGQYQMAMNEVLGKEVPVAGTYAHVAAHPQGIVSVLMAPIAGLYDPVSGQAGAIDVALFILIIGGFLGIVTKTGAIDAGIERVTTRLRGREEWMIPILMALFAAGGTIYGMAEESLPFYTLLVPVMLAARFDPVVAASTVLLGAGDRHARFHHQPVRDGDRRQRRRDPLHQRHRPARGAAGHRLDHLRGVGDALCP